MTRILYCEYIVHYLLRLIDHYSFEEGIQLPSIRKLSSQLNSSATTVQKALKVLEKDKYIYSVTGKGYFISASCKSLHNEKIRGIRYNIKKKVSHALFLGESQEGIERCLANTDSMKIMGDFYSEIEK